MQDRWRSDLEGLVAREDLIADPDQMYFYGFGPTRLPEVVVFPREVGQIASIMKLANTCRVPVIPFGGGTQLGKAFLPHSGGIGLSTSRMNKILEVDRENLTAQVEAGVTNQVLQEALRPANLFFPPDPPRPQWSTVGGEVAANAAGPKRLGYGAAKDYVLGLEAVTPTATLVRGGGKTVKNVSGYDLTRLFAGSWGIFGIIARVILRLRPVPEAAELILARFGKSADALEAARAIIKAGLAPTMLELISPWPGRTAGGGDGFALFHPELASLVIGVEGMQEAVDWQEGELLRVCRGYRPVELRTISGAEEQKAIWIGLRQELPSSLLAVEAPAVRGSLIVPRKQFAAAVNRLENLASERKISLGFAGHAGDGYLNFLASGRGNFRQQLLAIAGELDGRLVLADEDHDAANHASNPPPKVPDLPTATLAARLKASLDPNGILAPGSKAFLSPADVQGLPKGA